MNTIAAAVNMLQLFGEPTRVRLVSLLAHQELTVAELTSITDLGQSSVSTHLGKLREASVLRDRRAGASTYYALNEAAMPEAARDVWALVARDLDDAVVQADRERCDAIVRARENDAAWPDAVAGQMERHYSPGRTWEATARGLVGLMHLGDVLDAGSGDGTIAQLLAPRAKSLTLLDKSDKLIEAARARLSRAKNVDFRVGDVHELPFKDGAFDQVLLFNVLTHATSPPRAVAECARVLRKSGDLVIITLDAHDHAEVTAGYREVHAGFSPAQLKKMLHKAGLSTLLCDVTSREKRPPYFRIVTAFAKRNPS